MNGISGQMMKRIQGKGRGSIWTPKDFLDLGTRAAVDQALRRLVQKGLLQRLDRGVYSYPKVSPKLGALTPSPDTVAQAVAKATGSKLQVSGARAANALGLSTQVPSKSVYLTDGPSRTVRLGCQTIRLQHTSPGRLYGAGTRAGMAVQALRYLGPGAIDSQVIQKLSSQLSNTDKRALRRGVRQMPDWMRSVVDRIAAFA